MVLELLGVFFFLAPSRTSKGRCAAEQNGMLARRAQMSVALSTAMVIEAVGDATGPWRAHHWGFIPFARWQRERLLTRMKPLLYMLCAVSSI